MNRTTTLTLGTIFTVCALGVACASGGDDDGDSDGKAGSTGSGGTNSTAGTPSSGGSVPSAGTSATAGTSSTAGSNTGGTPGTAGSNGGPSVCDGMTRPLPLAEAYIDNVETEVRWANWYIFSDTTPAHMPPVARATTGALETGFSAHVAATGILPPTKKGFGAGIGFNLVNPAMEKCLDVTAFDGISFWAKGTSGTMNIVKFQAIAPATQPSDETPAGDCPSKMAACAYIHPAKSITLTPEWKQHKILFSELVSSAAPFSGKILQFNIITPDEAWDIALDEVTFYKGEAPTGPVEPPVAAGGSGGSGGGGNAGSGGTGGTQ